MRPSRGIASLSAILPGTAALVFGTADMALTGGDPERGRALMTRYGCSGCHTIPGVARANGMVGPPLAGVADRVYLGGVLTNTPGI